MKKQILMLTVGAMLLSACTKISEDDVAREVALNIGKCIETAIKENVPANHVGTYSQTRSWRGGSVEINGDFSGTTGDYTIKLTNVVFEYSHKDEKKEWKSNITQSGTFEVSQSGSIIGATSNNYSSNGTVSLKKKEKKHSGSGIVELSLTGNTNGNNAKVYGINVTW